MSGHHGHLLAFYYPSPLVLDAGRAPTGVGPNPLGKLNPMGESFLIALREGFEATLVVSIVLAFVRRSGHPELARSVWIGTAAALVVSAVAGLAVSVVLC